MTSAGPLIISMSQSALQAWERVKGLSGLLCSLSGMTKPHNLHAFKASKINLDIL